MKSPSPYENFLCHQLNDGSQDSCRKKDLEGLSYQKVKRNFLCHKAKNFEKNTFYLQFLLFDCWKPVHHAVFNLPGPFNLIKVYVVCQIINRLGQRRVVLAIKL